jgi:protein-S-isoprenylcysteine O-methyltransferase Ste14
MWTTIQIILGLLGVLLALGGDRLSIPVLTYAGIACFGLAAMAMGWEAILTRHIVLGRRRHGNVETYSGLPAILQGVQLNLMGLFLIGIAFMVYSNADGRAVVLQMARRPGLPLVIFGALCLMQAGISIPGPREMREGSRWIVIMNLLISRLLPGLILLGIGLGAVGLGLFEIFAPRTFDEMGGGFLEVLYELR